MRAGQLDMQVQILKLILPDTGNTSLPKGKRSVVLYHRELDQLIAVPQTEHLDRPDASDPADHRPKEACKVGHGKGQRLITELHLAASTLIKRPVGLSKPVPQRLCQPEHPPCRGSIRHLILRFKPLFQCLFKMKLHTGFLRDPLCGAYITW